MIALANCAGCYSSILSQVGTEYFVTQQLSFNNFLGTYINFLNPSNGIFKDLDGTLTGITGIVYVVPNLIHNNISGCSYKTSLGALVCGSTTANQRPHAVAFYAPQPIYQFQNQVMLVSNLQAGVIQSYSVTNPNASNYSSISYDSSLNGWLVTMFPGFTYDIRWVSVITPLDYVEINIQTDDSWLNSENSLTVVLSKSKSPEGYVVTSETSTLNYTLAESSALWTVTTGNYGDWYNFTNQFLFSISGRDSVTINSATQNRDGSDMLIQPYICKLNCPTPQSAPTEPFIRLWSNALQWPGGQVPALGQSVLVQSAWNMLLDTSPPALYQLVIAGKLFVNTTQTLTAQQIWVQGNLTAGNSSVPYTGTFTIVLTGSRTSSPLTLDNGYVVGNKAIAVTGTLGLFGNTVTVPWARLQQSVAVGATSITLTASVADYSVGDTLVIAPSFWGTAEYDEVTVNSITTNSNTLGISATSYQHYGCSQTITTNSQNSNLDMRAEVARLNRNIVIKSDSSDNSFGGILYVTEYSSTRRGILQLNAVRLENMGDITVTNREGIRMENLNPATGQISITSCVFHGLNGVHLYANNTGNLVLQNNIFYRSTKYSVHLISNISQLVFTQNLMIGNAFQVSDPFAACFFSEGNLLSSDSSVQNNVAAGCENHGWVVQALSCSGTATAISSNLAHSVEYGFYFTSLYSGAICIDIGNVQVYSASQVGVITYWGVTSVNAHNIVASDNNASIALFTGYDTISAVSFTLTNSWISGSAFLAAISTCASSLTLSSSNCAGLQGIKLGAATGSAKSFPPGSSSLPWYSVSSNHVIIAQATYSNLVFANFITDSTRGCLNNFPIRTNIFSTDASPVHSFSSITYQNSPNLVSQVQFDSSPSTFIGYFYCDSTSCSGYNNVLVRDSDGTLTGLGSARVLIPNNAGTSVNGCSNYGTNGLACTSNYGYLVFDSLDSDNFTRAIYPATLAGIGNSFNNSLSGYRNYSQIAGVTSRLDRFSSLALSGLNYVVSFNATTPNILRFTFYGTVSTSESITVRHQYLNAQIAMVTDYQGNVIQPQLISSTDDPTQILSSFGCGDNTINTANYAITIKLNASSTCVVYMKASSSIVVTIKYPLTATQIKSGGAQMLKSSLAALFPSVNTSSIRMAYVTQFTSSSRRRMLQQTYTNVTFIMDAPTIQQDPTATNAAQATLNNYIATLNSSLTNGGLPLLGQNAVAATIGSVLLGSTTNNNTISSVVVNQTTSSNSNSNGNSGSSNSSTNSSTSSNNNLETILLATLIPIGVIVLFSVFALVFMAVKRENNKNNRSGKSTKPRAKTPKRTTEMVPTVSRTMATTSPMMDPRLRVHLNNNQSHLPYDHAASVLHLNNSSLFPADESRIIQPNSIRANVDGDYDSTPGRVKSALAQSLRKRIDDDNGANSYANVSRSRADMGRGNDASPENFEDNPKNGSIYFNTSSLENIRAGNPSAFMDAAGLRDYDGRQGPVLDRSQSRFIHNARNVNESVFAPDSDQQQYRPNQSQRGFNGIGLTTSATVAGDRSQRYRQN